MDLAIPILPCRVIADTVAFYRLLGFTPTYEDANYVILRRGSTELHFFRLAELDPATSYSGCYIRTLAVEALYAAFARAGLSSTGIPRLDPIATKPWGMREFALVDRDGNLVRVGQPIQAGD